MYSGDGVEYNTAMLQSKGISPTLVQLMSRDTEK
jgi:hypothetical protein